MPEAILASAEADYGVWGEGEFVLPRLARALEKKEDWHNLPGLIWKHEEGWRRNPCTPAAATELPPMSRTWVDNRRYFRLGGQAGFETKRGCSGSCIYCADPVAKGKWVRMRKPAAVADELEKLLAQGVDTFHTCDSEFNIPEQHALEVCREITRRGLGNRLRWYAYCAPVPFSRELARTMRAAGCSGIDFGADNGSDEMLQRLGRNFGREEICRAIRRAKDEGMTVMLDLLLGSPGETAESIAQTVELVKELEPDCAGVSLGVRVYPGTELAERVLSEELIGGLIGGRDFSDPLFFMEPGIAPFVYEWLELLTQNDRRFLFLDPAKQRQNYNYNSNQRLVEAIRQGHRGAFWDILRRLPEG